MRRRILLFVSIAVVSLSILLTQGQYNKLQRVIFDNLGYKDVEIVSPSNDGAYEDLSGDHGTRFRFNAWRGSVAVDLLRKLQQERRPYELIKGETDKIQKWASVIVANIFETLFLLHKDNISSTQKYSHTIRSLQAIAESHSDIILRIHEHFENYHSGFTDEQQEELRKIKTNVTRLLWNTSIMLLLRKKVDYNYIANQSRKLNDFINEFDITANTLLISEEENGVTKKWGKLNHAWKLVNRDYELIEFIQKEIKKYLKTIDNIN